MFRSGEIKLFCIVSGEVGCGAGTGTIVQGPVQSKCHSLDLKSVV